VVIRNLPLLARLRLARRAHHDDVLRAAEELLRSQAARPAVLAAIARGEAEARRELFRILFRQPLQDAQPVVAAAMAASDSVVRLWAVRYVADARQLEALAGDRSPFVRREALVALFRRAPDAARRALFDRSALVRDAARVLLGETGDASDAAHVVPFLTHALPRIRRAAVRALARLGGNAYVETLVAMLADASPAVSSEARRALLALVARIDPAPLRELVRGATLPHVRRNALLLIAQLPKWQSIAGLLEAMRNSNPEISAMAHERVRDWNADYNRRQTMPARAEREDVRSAFAAAEPLLETWLRDDIALVIRSL
jgi:HEAT repeat protein